LGLNDMKVENYAESWKEKMKLILKWLSDLYFFQFEKE
jgi:hypothetical protein